MATRFSIMMKRSDWQVLSTSKLNKTAKMKKHKIFNLGDESILGVGITGNVEPKACGGGASNPLTRLLLQ